MKFGGRDIRPLWLDKDRKTVKVIDQRLLPHKVVIKDLKTVDDVIMAIKEMCVRGAPLIGVAAAYGVYLAAVNVSDPSDNYLIHEGSRLKSARPTAVNLAWAVDRMLFKVLKMESASERIETARKEAEKIVEEDVENCRKIGRHGLDLIKAISRKKGRETVNLLTHCNAGWLACIAYGTATAPIYAAYDHGIDIHVWVDETRPLNQGARLTAWEFGRYGVKHTVITDNAGGHLMQHGMVDMVIVGADRATCSGDIANKTGTYLKALAASDNNIPFYVALPSSTFDWKIRDGLKDIPVEERNPDEVRYVQGADFCAIRTVRILPAGSPALNYAFDVTPAKLITGFITDRGICKVTEKDIKRLFPEKG